MRYAGSPSWAITSGDSQALAVGLFLRDIAGLRSAHAWVPPAAPTVLPGPLTGSAEAASQWDQWWTQALAGHESWGSPPDFAPLSPARELRELLARYFSDAVHWSNQRKREQMRLEMDRMPDLLETHLVAELERVEGRRAKPFHLRITQIPAMGHELWQLDPHHLLVTFDLLADRDDYTQRLTPYIHALL